VTNDNSEPERGNKVKRFVDWVNADENLPSLEELGYAPEDFSGQDDDHHDEHSDIEEATLAAPISKADLNELTEDYDEDDEFEYPDEMLYEEVREAGDTTDYSKAHATDSKAVHISKRQKLQIGRFRIFYMVLSAIVAINVIVVMLITVNYLPPFGGADNPAVNEVYTRYIERGLAETGAPNIVSAILYSYRSFDTLGEAVVLFAAAIGVILLMREPKPEED